MKVEFLTKVNLTGPKLEMTSQSGNLPIAVVGASSMVGSRFCELFDTPVIRADLNGEISIDITNHTSVKNFFEKYQFESLILFSAFTNVDAAEAQRGNKNTKCWQINVGGVKNIVENCKKYRKILMFISTDFVFDGTSGPYGEDAPVGPDFSKVSWYGISKIEGEKIIQNSLENYLILRIAYPYRSNYRDKDDIVKRIIKLYKKGNLYPMFYDQTITPTFIDDLAPAINLLVRKSRYGVYHIASPTLTTQYDFAKKLLEKFFGKTLRLKKASIFDFLKKGNVTPRPAKGGLSVNKIVNLGFKPTDWGKGVDTIFTQSAGQLI